jgi:hypothetical protein
MKTPVLAAVLLLAVGCTQTPSGEPPPQEPAAADQQSPAGTDGDLTIGRAFDGYELSGTAGGPQAADELGPTCAGFIPDNERGNHLLVVEEEQALTLVAAPNGIGVMDLVLAIKLPDGTWVCADDSNDLNPVAARMFPDGEYRVYVGTHSDATAPYLLTIRPGIYTPDPIVLGGRFPAPITEGRPAERTAEGTYGGVVFGADSAQALLTGQAGGSRSAADVQQGCGGWIAQVPDHIVDISEQTEMTFRIRSATDTTLLIIGPFESKVCADDADGLNPVIRGTMLPGRYRVFVGTYEQLDTTAEYTLSISR